MPEKQSIILSLTNKATEELYSLAKLQMLVELCLEQNFAKTNARVELLLECHKARAYSHLRELELALQKIRLELTR